MSITGNKFSGTCIFTCGISNVVHSSNVHNGVVEIGTAATAVRQAVNSIYGNNRNVGLLSFLSTTAPSLTGCSVTGNRWNSSPAVAAAGGGGLNCVAGNQGGTANFAAGDLVLNN